MALATITSKGQLTIPKEIRDEYGLEEGDRVDFITEKNWFILVPLKSDILQLYGSVKHNKKAINFQKLREKIKRELAKIARR